MDAETKAAIDKLTKAVEALAKVVEEIAARPVVPVRGLDQPAPPWVGPAIDDVFPQRISGIASHPTDERVIDTFEPLYHSGTPGNI